MANIFYLKKGDNYPNIETILSDAAGPVNLTGSSVMFRMSVANTGNLMIEEPATIVSPQIGVDIGRCYYEFQVGDSDVLGTYRVEWVVTFGTGKVATFPRGSGTTFNQVIVQENVD